MHAGDDREDAGQIKKAGQDAERQVDQFSLGQQHQPHGYQLKGGGPFAGQGRSDHQGVIRQLQDQRSQAQDDVPADDHHRQPGRDGMGNAQGHKTGGHEQLIRQGVKVAPQAGFLLPPAGNQAVGQVAHSGPDEDDKRLAVAPLDQEDDEQRRQENTGQGNKIGNGQTGFVKGPRRHIEFRVASFWFQV